MLVLAGAGSGKTGVISHKIVHLIRQRGADPRHIYAVTFTNKAAREMKARVAELLGREHARGLNCSTFHALGLRILGEDAALLGLRAGFTIIDPEDAVLMVRELLRGEPGSVSGLADQVHRQISAWKNDGLFPESAAADPANPLVAAAARIYGAYDRQLRAHNSVDLDDLILLPVRLLRDEETVRARWRGRMHHLLVDEYQDTNGAQYQLVRLLVAQGAGLTVVGDDDQSIYAWRGARPENLERLQHDFPALTVIKLEQNYRSTGRILRAANALIGHNRRTFGKLLWSELGHGDPIRVIIARDEEHEAQRVVSSLLHHRFQQRARFGDYALLYRGNHQSRIFERMLREMRIPYQLSGELSFFDRSEIKDVLAYLRLLVNHADDNAFLRAVKTPRRGVGSATLERLAAHAAAQCSGMLDAVYSAGAEEAIGVRQFAPLRQFADWIVGLSDRAADGDDPAAVVDELIDQARYESWLVQTCDSLDAAEQRMANVRELVDWLRRLQTAEPDKGLAGLVATATLAGILERSEDEPPGDMVSLMTLHAAKGLEFPYVYIVGVEEDVIPHRTAVAEDSVEEERRLFYVGITRARRALTLSLARRRRRYGQSLECQPSRFLDELPAADLQWSDDRQELGDDARQQLGEAHLANIRALLG